MDADTLRLILIVLGGAVILGIYLWERHKRDGARAQAIRHGRRQQRVEPTLGGGDDAPREPPSSAEHEDESGLETALRELGDLVGEERKPRPETPEGKKKRDVEAKTPESAETRQQNLFPEEGGSATDHDTQAAPELPSMILQINVVTKDDGFEGLDVMRAVQGLGLVASDVQIFDRRDGKNRKGSVLFSMASMVKPGVFPLEAMETFKTPGLTLFAQLPGPRDGMTVFSDMLNTAEALATELGGELQDETHSRLTNQTVEHLRSQILEHRRKVQLAKSKQRRP